MASLKELREQRFFTTRELAAKAHVTTRTINRLEAGLVWPRFQTIKRLANGLGVEASLIEFQPTELHLVKTQSELIAREASRVGKGDELGELQRKVQELTEEVEGLKNDADLTEMRIHRQSNILAGLEAALLNSPEIRDTFITEFNISQLRDAKNMHLHRVLLARHTEGGLKYCEVPLDENFMPMLAAGK